MPSHTFYISDDRVQSAGSGRLRPDNFRNLELPLRIRRADDGLEFATFGRLPSIVPDDPGIGRHGCFDRTFIPRAARVKAQFHFADAVGAAEGDAAELLLLPANRLVMARAVDP